MVEADDVPFEAPEVDVVDQNTAVYEDVDSGDPVVPSGVTDEVDRADAWEQVVPVPGFDDDEDRGAGDEPAGLQ